MTIHLHLLNHSNAKILHMLNALLHVEKASKRLSCYMNLSLTIFHSLTQAKLLQLIFLSVLPKDWTMAMISSPALITAQNRMICETSTSTFAGSIHLTALLAPALCADAVLILTPC